MKRAAAKIVPKLLNFDQNENRMDIAQEMFNRRSRFVQKCWNWWRIMGVWLWKEHVKFGQKWWFCSLLSLITMVHDLFLPQGRTVNKEYFLEVMRRLREAIPQKRTKLFKNQSWILYYDILTHWCLRVSFLAKNKTVIMPYPPYSPDLAFTDFFLFPKLKTPIKGKRFATIEEIKAKTKQKCFEDRKKRCLKCTISDWSYFEGNKIVIDKQIKFWKKLKITVIFGSHLVYKLCY